MAGSLTKSPNRQTPNARSSEINNPIRKSFSGDPFAKPSIVSNQRGFNPITPVNSPSDFVRRNSTSGVVLDYEDKENGKDQNLKSARSQSLVASKGTKNFMSPTISAASKFTAPCPMKKILVEKIDSVRTSASSLERKGSASVSFSDVVQFIDSNPEMSKNKNEIETSCDSFVNSDCNEIDHIALASNVDENSELSIENGIVEPECILKRSETSPNPSSACPLAPQDADPTVPPYDPKTNYLSPRPQFLHYKPNPRLEIYYHREREGMRLDDNFISECFSDTEVTDETQTEDSQKESECGSEVDMVEMGEEEDLHVSLPTPIRTPIDKESAEKLVSKPQFFAGWKTLAGIMFLLTACLSVSVMYSPFTDPSVFKDSSFTKLYVPSDLPEFAQENFHRLAKNFQLWTAKHLSYISLWISEFGVHRLESLKYINITALHEDHSVGGYSIFNQKEQNLGREIEAELLEGKTCDDDKHIEELTKGHNDAEYEEHLTTETDAHDNSEEILEESTIWEVYSSVNDELIEARHDESEDFLGENSDKAEFPVVKDEAIEPNDNGGELLAENGEVVSGLDFNEQSVLTSSASVLEAKYIIGEDNTHYYPATDSTIAEENLDELLSCTELDASVGSQSSETVDAIMLDESQNKLWMQTVLGISSFVLAICASTSFIYARKSKTPYTNVKASISLSSPNLPTEMEMIGESIPPEISSIQKTSSFINKELKNSSEAQSEEERKPRKKYKRESLVSSSEYSTISPSYGSFTTFERFPTKHHHGLEDEEVVTPVRRSSRIKNKVTSP